MAERLPDLLIKIQSAFDPKGIQAAKREIKNFSNVAEKDVGDSEKKFKALQIIWDKYAAKLKKDNPKVKKSIDAVAASFERVEKANKRIKDAETSKTKALLTLENKRLDLQKKIEKSKGFGENAENVSKEYAAKAVTELYKARMSAIKKAEENEIKFKKQFDDASLKERQAYLNNEKAIIQKNEKEKLKDHLSQDRKRIMASFRGRGISVQRDSSGFATGLSTKKGRLQATEQDLKKIVDAEDKLARATVDAADAALKQEAAYEKLRVAQEKLITAKENYNNAANATKALPDALPTQEEYQAIIEQSKNRALAEGQKLSQDVAKAQNNLASAEASVEKATRNVDSAMASYNHEVSTAIVKTQEETSKINGLVGAMAKIKTGVKTASNSLGKLYSRIKNINITRVVAMFYSLSRVGSFLNSFVEASSSWIENLNLLEVVYNGTADAADNVKERVKELSKTFRMDINALTQYISTFKQMANAMGQAEETGSRMADVLSLIALDVSSLRNVSVEQAVSDFTGALAGQVKPVRKYGFDITMYSIEELMREVGFTGNARTMSQSNKQLARAILLIRQSKDAWGDLSKTINTYANQQRILNDQMTQFKRSLGSVLLGTFKVTDTFEEASKTAGILQKGIWYLNGAFIAVNRILEAIIPTTENFNGAIATGAEDAVDALEEEEEALNGALASFDKFNALQSSDGDNGGISAALDALLNSEADKYMDELDKRLQSINMYAEDIADNILEILFPDFKAWQEGNIDGTFEEWAATSDDFRIRIEEIKETLLGIGQIIMWIANPLLGIASTALTNFLNADSEEEKQKMLEELTSTIQAFAESLLNVGTVLFDLFAAFAPFISAQLTMVRTIAELEGGVWALVAAFIALLIAKEALSGGFAKAALGFAGVSMLILGISGGIAAAKQHADGGFQTGGLFYAGEAGPEWVGRQGNTATIINDNQMSDIMMDSVAKGVMKANMATRQMGGAQKSGGKVAVVNINGKHLFDVVEQEGYKEGKVFAKSR